MHFRTVAACIAYSSSHVNESLASDSSWTPTSSRITWGWTEELEASLGPGGLTGKDRHIKAPNRPNCDFSGEINPNCMLHLGVKIDWVLSKITSTKHKLLQIIIRSYTHKSQEKIFYYLLILLIYGIEPILVSTSSSLQARRLQSVRKEGN